MNVTSIWYVERQSQFQIHFVFCLIISYVMQRINYVLQITLQIHQTHFYIIMYLYMVHLLHCKMSQLLDVKIFTHISVALFPLNCRDFFAWYICTESGWLILKSMINVWQYFSLKWSQSHSQLNKYSGFDYSKAM